MSGAAVVTTDDQAAAELGRAFRQSVAGLALLDPEGRLRGVNEAFCRLLGRAPDDLVGRDVSGLAHPDERGAAQRVLAALRDREIEVDYGLRRCPLPDGNLIVLSRSTTALRAPDGELVGFLTQVVDAAAHEDTAQALRRVENRSRALLAHAAELTLLVDRSCRLTYVSPAAERLLGQRPEELVGRCAFSFIHPDDLERAEAAFAAHCAAGQPAPPPGLPPPTYRIRHRAGTWRDVEVIVSNLFDDTDVGALVLNVRDVTERRAWEERLAASERRLRALIGNSSDLIWLLDPAGRIAYCSPAVVGMLGYSPEALVGTDPAALVHPDDEVGRWPGGPEDGTAQDRVLTCRVRHANGSWRWLESTAHDQRDDPAVAGVVVTSRDITGRRRRSAQREAIVTLSRAALRGGDIDGLFARAVDLVAEILEVPYCTILEVTGTDELTVAHRHGPPLVAGPFSAVVDGRPVSLAGRAYFERRTVVWRGDPGEMSPILQPRLVAADLRSGAASPIGDTAAVAGVLVVYAVEEASFCEEDATFLEAIANVLGAALARHEVEEELRRRAHHDMLTGLPNRELLRERLEAALDAVARRGSGVALIFVDTDDFKLVNDSLGHAAGDQIVTAVAARLQGVLRPGDLVARFGGDEFVVLCEHTGRDEAERVAARVRDALAAPIVVSGRTVVVTASVGIALTDDPQVRADDLLAQADTAMYAAKRAGKDRAAVFDVKMRHEVNDRLEATSGLLRAVTCEELRLHYQPVVDAETGAPVACEALLRWQHPSEGLLLPERFIGHAEDSGAIVAVGAWVLDQACRQAAAWRRGGYGGQVSINVSARQLADAGIVAAVEEALERSGVEPSRVLLEVTESAVTSDLRRTARVIDELHALGVRVGMDDFGTGYSSLSNLANLPFEFVKIDRAFITAFGHDRRASALLESIAALCRRLDLPAIAEGVETEPQLDQVRRLGIPYVQGFLFGRPVPPASLPPGGPGLDTAAR